MIFPQKTITNHVLLISALVGLCFCDYPPLTMWQMDDFFRFPICAKIDNMKTDAQQQPSLSRFCPDKQITVEKFGKAAESCLFETSNSNEMDCAEKVVPILSPFGFRCGFKKKGTGHIFSYKLCEIEQNVVKILSFKTIFTLCFDHSVNKVLYVKHQIYSPTLINHRDLPDERIRGRSFSLDDLDVTSLREPLRDTKNYEEINYTSLLADPADMAFRVWRYTFFHYINAVVINEDLVQRWDKINNSIRELAKEKLGEITIVTGTGVITKERDSPTLSPTNDISAPVLWKIVYTELGHFAVAIIVQNAKSDQDIIRLCEPNSCQKIGWQEIIPENFDNFVECCDPSLIIQRFDLLDAYALTSMPQYQSVFHREAQKCNPEKQTSTKKEFPFVKTLKVNIRKEEIKEYLSESGRSIEAFQHFCPGVGELHHFVLRKYKNQDRLKKCLYESKGIYDYCDNAVQPFIEYKGRSCPNIEDSAYYHMQYNLCFPPLNPIEQKKMEIVQDKMYSICYSKVSNKIKYLDYYFKTPKLLANEQIIAKNIFVSGFETFNDGINELNQGIENIQKIFEKNIRNANDNGLVPQMLVPSENMVFAAGKKATYHFLNVQPMWSHRTLAWNHINQFIRNVAIRRNWCLHIVVGVLDDHAPESIDETFSSIWWIYIMDRSSGIVVFMHNDSADTEPKPICGSYQISCEEYGWQGIIPEGVLDNSVYCCNGEFIAKKMGLDSPRYILRL